MSAEPVANWEKGRTKPVPSQFKPVVSFLGYDPTPGAITLAERFEAKRRSLGATLDQVAEYLDWDNGSLRRYLKGEWRLSLERAKALDQFLGLDTEAAAAVLRMPRRKR
ncbi:MAG: helix-turn-helix domain-containing protein [Alphaproteobacteria bacterium]